MSDSTAYIILTYTSLLAIINPLSAIPVFLGMTGSYSPVQRRRTLTRAARLRKSRRKRRARSPAACRCRRD